MVVGVVAYRDFRANLYLESGRQDLRQGRVLEAKEKLERSSQLAFQPAIPLFYLGEIYWELGNYQQAVYFLERSLPGRVTEATYLLLAQAYAELKNDEKAWGYLHQLLAAEPHPIQKVQAYYLRAQLFRRRGDLKMALAQLKHVIQQASGLIQVKAYTLMAEIYREQGEHKSARAFYLQGLNVAEAQLHQKKDLLKEQLAGQGLPFSQYVQLTAEIAQLEEQVMGIHGALEALPSP
jgi:tetratricopeptide (TPR) repeat protein